MRIWYDACTGKQVRYGTAIARRLRKIGHEVVFTTRRHPDTLAVVRILGEKQIIVGKWNPESLATRVKESASRMLSFVELFGDSPPDAAICHQSVELCRVAFGLGIPLIVTADTPHATAVNRLTIPLATTLLFSEAIPKRVFSRYGAQHIVQFKGVDEVAWIRGAKPISRFDFKRPLIVVRQIETKSAYALKKHDITIEVARKLSKLGTVVFLSRYGKTRGDSFITLEDTVDSVGLTGEADLVVSVGGTMAREAALQGTPSIVIAEFDPIEVNDYLSKKGFPLWRVEASEVIKLAKGLVGKKIHARRKLASLEDPVDRIEQILRRKHSTD